LISVAALAVTLVGVTAVPAAGDKLHYRPGAALPAPVSSPAMAPDAPWTPLVKSLMHQLEPAQPDPQHDQSPAVGTTVAQLMNVDTLLFKSANSGCPNVGYVDAPTGTNPVIPPQCWTDAQGVLVLSGPQVRETTATMNHVGIASSWDPRVMNAWGQVQGTEGRELGVTGIYAPQVDLIRIPNWGRNVAVLGEDPFLMGTLAAGEVNGIQGTGLMSQIKHFAFYNGQPMDVPSDVQDQAAREMILPGYEYGTSGSGVLPHPGQASSMMCSYASYKLSVAPGASGTEPSALAPPAGDFSCNNQLKNFIVRSQWRWLGFFATDYEFDLQEPVLGIESGTDQDFSPPPSPEGQALVAAVMTGAVPLSTFNAAAARILYEDERFHLIGHAGADSNYLSPSHPTTATGQYPVPAALKVRNSAIVESSAEKGGVLLKDAHRTLPITRKDMRKGILVIGEAAEYMPADPGTETAAGYPDRDAISPLEQLRQFAPKGSKITFMPYMPDSNTNPGVGIAVPSSNFRAGVMDGLPVPATVLSPSTDGRARGLTRTSGPGTGRVDPTIDFTSLSHRGQLEFGKTYTWHGFINVPAADHYIFHFQFSVPGYTISPGSINGPGQVDPAPCSGSSAPNFGLASSSGSGQMVSNETLSTSPPLLGVNNPQASSPTMSGYTERGLGNCEYDAGTLSAGVHEIQISWTTPASFAPDTFRIRAPGSRLPSFRFAYSRAGADRAEAIALARKAAKVIVFADCTCVNELTLQPATNVNELDDGPTQLIQDMAAANRNTAVVTNFDVATLMPWLGKVGSVLQMWYPGSEGGAATARLLLGLADPSGHLTTTWPASQDQTLYAYNQTKPLYPGDSTGVHSERITGTPFINWTEGIYIGYRFFDKEGIKPLFPFGYGLSYTTFRYSHLKLRPASGGLNVTFTVANTGSVPGTAVPQVYVGPAPSVPAGVQQADRSLAGFDRITLAAHHSRTVTLHLGPGRDLDGYGNRRAFHYWDTASQSWRTAPGRRRLWVGSADSTGSLVLTGEA
jgi:beta-glucosidase